MGTAYHTPEPQNQPTEKKEDCAILVTMEISTTVL